MRAVKLAGGNGIGTRGLLLYGGICAVLGCALIGLLNDGDWPVSGTRAEQLEQALTALRSGEPPLLARNIGGSEYLAQFANEEGYYFASAGDDPGLYLYAPLVARTLGLDHATDAVTVLALLAFGLTTLLYPVLIRDLLGSTAAALAAPIILVGVIVWQAALGDVYWASSWAVLTLAPILLLLLKRWPRHGLLILLAVAVAASFATSIRSHAGLPIAIAAVGLVATRRWTLSRRVLVGVAVIACYLSVAPVGFRAVEAYRDGQIDDSPVGVTRAHPFWHNAYLGLGYLENDYGIKWYDSLAARHAQAEDPGVGFATPSYEAALRERYLRFVEEEPGTAVATTVRKAVASIFISPLLLLMALLGLWLLARDPALRPLSRNTALILAPSALLGLLPATLVIPTREYAGAWIGAMGLAAILGAAAVVSSVAVRRARGSAVTKESGLGGALGRRTLIAGAIVAALTIGGVLWSESTRNACSEWQDPEPDGAVGYYTGCESSLHPAPLEGGA